MTLPYDIARCYGARDIDGRPSDQCRHCQRRIYSRPEHVHLDYQPWTEPRREAQDWNCHNYIAPQPTKTKP